MPRLWKTFRVEALTPDGRVGDFEAIHVLFPATDGLVGVLGGHAPLVAALGGGPMTVEMREGGRKEFFVSGGVLQFREDVMTVLAEECFPLDQIDREEAWQRISDARRLPVATDEQRACRTAALTEARTLFRLVQTQKAPAHRRMAGE